MGSAIIHLDGDAFFASCEIALNPKLRGKCVVTGLERGIASSMSYEAKARGVARGMTIGQIRKVCPEAVIIPSDYDAYRIFSRRMFSIVRRYTDRVEEYGIDEGFADLSDIAADEREAVARAVRQDLLQELDLSYSVGLASTKVLAKTASKSVKPSGFVAVTAMEIESFLKNVPLGSIWGIGPATAAKLRGLGVETAGEFIDCGEWWVREHCAKPHVEIWHELRGTAVIPLAVRGAGEREAPQSISRTRTFRPASSSESFVFSQLSRNIEHACEKLRRVHMRTRRLSFFIKTQEFTYSGEDIELPHATNAPTGIIRAAGERFSRVFQAGVPYRATGVTLRNLSEESVLTVDLFGAEEAQRSTSGLYEKIDGLNRKYRDAVFLGSSMRAREGSEVRPKHLSLPLIGAVT